jgi:hypothetical protein
MNPDIEWHIGEEAEQETIAHVQHPSITTRPLGCDHRDRVRRGPEAALSIDP